MKVVIVGAGPSGLVTCKTLLEAANDDFPFEPIILEQEDNIGGTFRYRSYEVIELFSTQLSAGAWKCLQSNYRHSSAFESCLVQAINKFL